MVVDGCERVGMMWELGWLQVKGSEQIEVIKVTLAEGGRKDSHPMSAMPLGPLLVGFRKKPTTPLHAPQ